MGSCRDANKFPEVPTHRASHQRWGPSHRLAGAEFTRHQHPGFVKNSVCRGAWHLTHHFATQWIDCSNVVKVGWSTVELALGLEALSAAFEPRTYVCASF